MYKVILFKFKNKKFLTPIENLYSLGLVFFIKIPQHNAI